MQQSAVDTWDSVFKVDDKNMNEDEDEDEEDEK